MTLIATETNDSPARLSEMAAAQRGRPGFAIDAYFYRSQVVYRKELDEIGVVSLGVGTESGIAIVGTCDGVTY